MFLHMPPQLGIVGFDVNLANGNPVKDALITAFTTSVQADVTPSLLELALSSLALQGYTLEAVDSVGATRSGARDNTPARRAAVTGLSREGQEEACLRVLYEIVNAFRWNP